MRKRSKFMVLLLSCLMVFSMLPTVVFAADEIATAKNGTTITKNTTQASEMLGLVKVQLQLNWLMVLRLLPFKKISSWGSLEEIMQKLVNQFHLESIQIHKTIK